MSLTLIKEYYDAMKSGTKPVEGRKMSPTWIGLKVGDLVEIKCEGYGSFLVEIIKINYYPPNLKDPLSAYLASEGLNNVLPGITDLDDARKIYVDCLNGDEIKEYGMMGIHVKLLS